MLAPLSLPKFLVAPIGNAVKHSESHCPGVVVAEVARPCHYPSFSVTRVPSPPHSAFFWFGLPAGERVRVRGKPKSVNSSPFSPTLSPDGWLQTTRKQTSGERGLMTDRFDNLGKDKVARLQTVKSYFAAK